MDEVHNLLSDVLHHLAPFYPLSPYIRVRPEDYIVETQGGGFFRLAWSPSTQTVALFAAAHPEDLAAVREASGRLGIRHKGRPILVDMYRPHHSPAPAPDGRKRLDLSWAGPVLQKWSRRAHRARWRERVLHRRADRQSCGSAFVRYNNLSPDQGAGPVWVLTKTDHNFALPEIPAERVALRGNAARRLFRRASRAMLERYPAVPLLDENGQSVLNSCASAVLTGYLLRDFHHKHQRIVGGHDPLSWLEKPSLPLFRATAALESGLHHLREEFTFAAFEHHMRRAGMIGVYGALLGAALSHTLIRSAIYWGGELGVKEKILDLPKEWRKMEAGHSRRLLSVDSALHRLSVRPRSESFGDFEWLNPAEYACSFLPDTGPAASILSARDRGHTFRLWLANHFLSPPTVALGDYVGAKGGAVDPGDEAKIRFYRLQCHDGMMLYYVPRTGRLYGHYHKPGYVAEDKLPGDAAEFLKTGRVLSCDLFAPRKPFKSQSFGQFQKELSLLAGARNLDLPSADAPGPDAFYPAAGVPAAQPKIEMPEPALPVTARRELALEWPFMMM